MIWRALSWCLLFTHFFAHEPYREQILAVQTITCALQPTFNSLHIITFIIAILYFVQTEHRPDIWISVVHHLVVACCILCEYYMKEWHLWSWLVLCWSIRWLSSIHLYQEHPIRACIRCMVFAILVQKRFTKTFKEGFKWCWILLVHEIAWCALPFQMLYEVYKKKEFVEDSAV